MFPEDGFERHRALAEMQAVGLPFVPLAVKFRAYSEYDGEKPIKPIVAFSYSCSKLGISGKCMIYDRRPQLCRDYKVGQDSNCVFFKE